MSIISKTIPYISYGWRPFCVYQPNTRSCISFKHTDTNTLIYSSVTWLPYRSHVADKETDLVWKHVRVTIYIGVYKNGAQRLQMTTCQEQTEVIHQTRGIQMQAVSEAKMINSLIKPFYWRNCVWAENNLSIFPLLHSLVYNMSVLFICKWFCRIAESKYQSN